MKENHLSTIGTASLFLCTSALLTLLWKREKESLGREDGSEICLKRKGEKRDEISSSQNIARQLTKSQVESLRMKYFCRKVTVSYANSGPLMIVGGKGSKLIDYTGKSYLDTRNNVAHVGHSHLRVVESVQQQVGTLNTNTRYLHPNAVLLAERLCGYLPDPLNVVFFVNSGSEANDLALRLARAFTRSNNTIVVDGGYHGHTLACLEVSPYKYENSKEFVLSAPKKTAKYKTPGHHIWKVPCPDIYRGEHRDIDDAGIKYSAYVEEACRYYCEDCRENVGAFVVEGGMSVAGVILPPAQYMSRSVQAVRDAGGVYIADEIQTGFGRLGSCFWAFQHRDSIDGERLIPDIVTVGKPFGNGMPLAAVVTSRAISDAFEGMGVEYFNTFGGNPVCAGAGLAVLDVLESEALQKNAAKVGQYLKEKFLDLSQSLDIIGDVRGSGLFIGIELVRDRMTQEPAEAETSFLCTIMKEKYSILTSIDGLHNNVLVVKPPMVFSMADADEFAKGFENAVRFDLQGLEDINSLARTPT